MAQQQQQRGRPPLTSKQIYAYRHTRALLFAQKFEARLVDTYLPFVLDSVKKDPVLFPHLDMNYEDAYNNFLNRRTWEFDGGYERRYVADEYRKDRGVAAAEGRYYYETVDREADVFCWRVREGILRAIAGRVWIVGGVVARPSAPSQEALGGKSNLDVMSPDDASEELLDLRSEVDENENERMPLRAEVSAGSNLHTSFGQTHQAFPGNNNQFNAPIAPNVHQQNPTQGNRRPPGTLPPNQQYGHLTGANTNPNMSNVRGVAPQTNSTSHPPQFHAPPPPPTTSRVNGYPFSAIAPLLFQEGYERVTQQCIDQLPNNPGANHLQADKVKRIRDWLYTTQ